MASNNAKFLTHQDAAILNRNLVLNYIKENAPVSRTDIWENTDLSRASVTQIIKQLIEHGYVYEKGTGESRGGRKPCYLEFNANVRNIIVYDWHLKSLFLTDLNANIIYRKNVQFNGRISPDEFSEMIAEAVNETIEVQKLDIKKVIGFGLVIPGMIDPVNGNVILFVEQGWKNVNLKSMVESKTGIETTLEMDSNMLALGEFKYGVGNEEKNFVLLDVEDDGIGFAFIINGECYRGSNNMNGEIGHVSLNNEGPKCSCGRNGCIEAYIKEVLRRKTNNWKKEAAYYIGIAASIIINALDPRIIVLSGNVIEKGGEELVSSIRNVVLNNVLKADKRNIKIEKSTLGQYGRIKGICSLIYENNFYILK
ncbi:MAG TPA: ROK family transcriptional regulator [Clostridiaceae bacterium]|nr:ROK family transcriptional regulator [Clostridiaceae bacterium]